MCRCALIEVRPGGITVGWVSGEFFGSVGNAIFVAREYCHDRSVAGQPLATVGTFGQHRLELAELAVGRIDNYGEWVIASLFRRVFGRNIALKQFHARRNLPWRATSVSLSKLSCRFSPDNVIAATSAHVGN